MAGSSEKLLVGVDLGGTKIMAGVFDASLECISFARISTKPQRGDTAVVARIVRCVQDAFDEGDLDIGQVAGIGIGAPGAVDPESGRVLFAPNLGWENFPLKKELQKHLPAEVFVDNDCNICALGVYEKELPTKPAHMIGIFLGTGIGAGIMINGELYYGFNRTAGEIGHMVIDINGPLCKCGNRGCFEALAGRAGIFERIKAAVRSGQGTVLTELLGPELTDMRSRHLRKAIRRGDTYIEKLMQEVAVNTGIAVGGVLNLLNPEVVVLGGGLIDALESELMPTITRVAMDHAMPGTTRGISILASRLGDNAGIVGGAVLARRGLSRTAAGLHQA